MPELGKATYVVEIDSRQFDRGLDRVEKRTLVSATKQDKAVSDMADSWNDATLGVSKNTKELDKNTKSVDRSSRSTRNFGRDITVLNQGFSLLGKTMRLLKLPVFAVGISVAAAAVSQLTGGIVALAGAMGPAAGAAASLGNAYLALGQAFGVIKLAGFSKLTQAMQGNEEAFKSLTPAAKKFGATLMGLKPIWKNLQAAVQGELFGGLTRGIKSAMQNFGRFKNAMVGMAGVLGTLGEKFGKLLGSKSFGKLFSKVTAENEQIVMRLGRALMHLIPAFFQVLAAARPLTDWLTKAAVAWSKNVEESAKAGAKSGELARFFEHTRQILSKLWSITSNFTHALINLGSIGRKTGMDLFGHMNRAAKSFREFTESAEGRNEIARYFDRIKPGLVAMGRLLSTLTKGFIALAGGGGMKKTADSLTTMVKPLTHIMNVLSRDLGPTLAKSLGDVLRLFSHLTKYTAPIIKLALQGIGGLARGLNQLIQGNKVLRAVATGLALVWAAMRAMAITTFILRITGMQKAWMLLTTSLFRTRLAYIGLTVQQKAAAAGAKLLELAMAPLKKVVYEASFALLRMKEALMASAAMGKVTSAFAAVKAAVLGLSLTVRAAMLATGIGALIVGATLIATHWKQAKAVLGAVWNWIKGAAETIGNAVMWAIKHGFLGPIPLIISHWKDILGFLKGVWNGVKNAAGTAWKWIKQAATNAFNFFKSAASEVFKVLSWPYRMWWKVARSVFGFIVDKVRDVVGFISDHWQGIQSVLTAPWRFFKGVAGDILDWIGDKIDWLIDKADDLWNKFKDPLGIGGDGGGGIFPDQSIAGMLGLASGGYVTKTGVQYFKKGGFVSRSTDTVPAMLTPGEAVISKPAVDAMGGSSGAAAMNSVGTRSDTDMLLGLDPDAVVGAVKKITDALKRLRKDNTTIVKGMSDEATGRTRTMNEAIASNFVNGQRQASKHAEEMRKRVVDRIGKMEEAAHKHTRKMAKNTKDDAKKMKDSTKDSTGAAKDSWESLGGKIDTFQRKSGKDVDKHKRNTEKDMKGVGSALAGVAGGWLGYSMGVDAATKKGDKSAKGHRDKSKGFLEDIIDKGKDAVGGWVDYADGLKRQTERGTKAAKAAKVGTSKSIGDLVDAVSGGIVTMAGKMNKALKALGVKPVNFGVTEDKGKGAPDKKQFGGIVGLEKGAIVPGSGSGDKVPLHIGGQLAAMVEPNELVSVANRTATAALMKVNGQVPRRQYGGLVASLATGGVAQPPGDPGSEVVQAAYAEETGRFMQRFDMNLTQGYNPSGPSVSPGHLQLGVPPSLDVIPLDGDWDHLFADGLKWALAQGMQVGYDGQYGTQAWDGHGEGNHAHIDWKSGSDALGIGGAASTVKAVPEILGMLLSGPDGAAKSYGQAVLDKTHAAMSKYLSSQSAGGGAMMHGDGNVEKIFADVARKLAYNKTAALALGEAGYAESGMQDLSYGDSSSEGALQLLASTASSMGIDPHDEAAVASTFLTRGYYTRGANESVKMGLPAHLAAQAAQGSAFSDGSNYLAQEGAARAWMQRYHLKKGGLVPGLAGGGVTERGEGKKAAHMPDLRDITRGVNRYTGSSDDKPKRQKKILTHLLDKMDVLGEIDPGLVKKLAGLEDHVLEYDEMAQRAADRTSYLNTPDDTGLVAKIDGKTQAEWLQKKLDALWSMRNKLIRANNLIQARADKIAKLIRQTTRKYNDAMKRVAEIKKQLEYEGKDPGDKYKGKLNPFDAAIGKWNALKDAERAKFAHLFEKVGGKLPGDRKFLKDYSLATPDTDPKLFPSAKEAQQKADTYKGIVLPSLQRQQRAVSSALSRAAGPTPRALSEVQGDYGSKEVIKGRKSNDWISQNMGGDLLTTALDIKNLGVSGGSVSDDTSELLDLYRQLALEGAQRSAVLSSQMPVFSDFFGLPQAAAQQLPFAGVFHEGLAAGAVPGRRGQDVAIIAQAGEVVAQPDQLVAPGSTTDLPAPVLIIEEGAGVDEDKIKLMWKQQGAETVSRARRRISP